jgi:hypothetical protein
MITNNARDTLLECACPSIQYRLRLELLGEDSQTNQMQELQKKILWDKKVQEVIAWQQDDGWLAWDFHGQCSIESGIRILCEKGISPANPVLAKALQALEAHPERTVRGLGKVGPFLDENALGGSNMIRAVVYAYAGVEQLPFIQQQIQQALDGFRAVLNIHTIDDLVEPYHDHLILRKGLIWPSLYHLRLLASTHSWRNPDNLELFGRSLTRLVELSPIPAFYVRKRSQLIAPASFCMDHFAPRLDTLDDMHWMMWFQRMEFLARTGVVHLVPALQSQIIELQNYLDSGKGLFTLPLNHRYFREWNAYTGLMLENDWRTPQRRINDLSFRSLLIQHYAAE